MTAPTILDRAAVAALLGVQPGTVSTYRARYRVTHPTPQPETTPAGWEYWTDGQAWLDWAAARPGRTGRPRKEPHA